MKMVDLMDDLERRLKNYSDRKIKSIFVKIKYFDFTRTTAEVQCEEVQFENFWTLFIKRFANQTKEVRLLGLGVRFFCEAEGQLELPINLV